MFTDHDTTEIQVLKNQREDLLARIAIEVQNGESPRRLERELFEVDLIISCATEKGEFACCQN